MKINKVHIYGFGKWQSFSINQFQSLQLIYGENEAGKSTILRFVKSILFGFPTKQKGELLYIPKTTQMYGGEIECLTKTHGTVKIKRIKGKSAAGDVTVTLENGQIGNELLLEKILNGFTVQMFQSIYSFDVHGLQQIQKMKGVELSRYLLHAGSIGSDTFLKAEQQLKKQQELLFKPNGRNPVLNQSIKDLKEQDKHLKAAKKKNEAYHHILSEINMYEEENEAYQSNIQKLSDQLRLLKLAIKNWDDIQSWHQLTKQMKTLDINEFPAGGEKKLFYLEEKEQETTLKLRVLKEKKENIQTQIRKLSLNHTLLKHANDIQTLASKKENTQHLIEQLDRLQLQIQQQDNQLDEWKRQLGWMNPSTDHLQSINVSFQTKEAIQTQMKNFYQLKAQMEEKKNQVTQMKRDVQHVEFQCDQIEKKMVSEKEYRSLIDSQHKKETVENNKQLALFSYIFVAMSFIFTILALIRQDYMLFIGLVLCFVLSLFLTVVQHKKNKQQPTISNSLNEKVEEQHRLRQQWKEAIVSLESKQFHYNQLLEEQQSLYKKEEKIEKTCTSIRQQLLLSNQFPVEQLSDALGLVEKIQTAISRKNDLIQTVSSYQKQLDNWEQSAYQLFNKLERQTGLFLIEDMTHLERELQETKEKEISWKELHTKLEECAEQLDDNQIQLHTIQQQIQLLVESSGADSRESFLIKAKNKQQKEDIEKQLHVLDAKLSSYPDQLLYTNYTQLENQSIQITNQLDDNRNALNSNQEKLAKWRFEQERLEVGGTFTELLHAYHDSAYRFNEQAKEWATISLSLQLLKQSLAHLTKERFPKVMTIAQSYFRHLTNSQQTTLLLQEDQFIIKKENGNLYGAEELSQATTEQLYISLRFALVTMLQETNPFPLIIDDGFVHFDQVRTNNVVQLLKQMSQYTQIIFFTCHAHIKELFRQENIVVLSDKQVDKEYMKNKA